MRSKRAKQEVNRYYSCSSSYLRYSMMHMKYIIMIATALILAGCPSSVTTESDIPSSSESDKTGKSSPPKHTKDTLKLIQKRIANNEAILIDVREKDEWEDGHLQSATSLPLSILEEGPSNEAFIESVTKNLPKDKIIYCHCAAGGRVMPASAILHKMGYDIRPLKAGYKDLLKVGFNKASE